jgi:rhodanese-related sulfurtransferase
VTHKSSLSLRALIASICVSSALVSTHSIADAQSGKVIAPLKENMPYLFVVHQGRSIKVERDIDSSFRAPASIRGSLMTNSEVCPPFCLLPNKLDIPVETVGEAEIVDFMLSQIRDNKGSLIDVRSKSQYKTGTIPGSLHYPITRFKQDEDGTKLEVIFEELGAKRRDNVSWIDQQLEQFGLVDTSLLTPKWDFTKAKDLIFWSNAATSTLSPDAIRIMYKAGYPAQKMRWYRGGIAAWHYWGFTTFKTK